MRMQLKTLLTSQRGLASLLAKSIDVKPATVSQWANEKKQVPEGQCVPIERFFKGQIRCEELRPDIAHKFAYLRKTKRSV